MRKAHGQHNLNLSDLLLTDGNYNDWVITTSFYSAVHFVEHALFPLIENGIQYRDFNDYWYNVYYPQHISKHSCKKRLVNRYLKKVNAVYRDLFDDCNNSRYIDYRVSDSEAKAAKDKADKIKVVCLAKKP